MSHLRLPKNVARSNNKCLCFLLVFPNEIQNLTTYKIKTAPNPHHLNKIMALGRHFCVVCPWASPFQSKNTSQLWLDNLSQVASFWQGSSREQGHGRSISKQGQWFRVNKQIDISGTTRKMKKCLTQQEQVVVFYYCLHSVFMTAIKDQLGNLTFVQDA